MRSRGECFWQAHRGRTDQMVSAVVAVPRNDDCGRTVLLELKGPFQSPEVRDFDRNIRSRILKEQRDTRRAGSLIARAVPGTAVKQDGFAVADRRLNDLRPRPVQIGQTRDEVVGSIFPRKAFTRGRFLKTHAIAMRSRYQPQRTFLSCVEQSDPDRNEPTLGRTRLDIAVPRVRLAGLPDDKRRPPTKRCRRR